MVFHQATRDVIIKETRILSMFTIDKDIKHIQKICIFKYFFSCKCSNVENIKLCSKFRGQAILPGSC